MTFAAEGMLAYHSNNTEVLLKSVASVTYFSPVTFSAQIHLTSELLRFL